MGRARGRALGRERRPLRALVGAPPAPPDQPGDHQRRRPRARHRVRRRADDARGGPRSPRTERRSASTCRRRCSLGPRSGPPPRASATSPSCRATRRCTRSSREPPTSPSASTARCSSATPSPPSRNIARGLRPGGRLALLDLARARAATSGSPRSAAPSRSGATSRHPRRTLRHRSRWPTLIASTGASPPPASATSSSIRSTSRRSSARTPTTHSPGSQDVGDRQGAAARGRRGRARAGAGQPPRRVQGGRDVRGRAPRHLGLADHRHSHLTARASRYSPFQTGSRFSTNARAPS